MKKITKDSLPSAKLKENDLKLVIDSELHTKGLVKHHVESFNEFTRKGIKQIIEDLFKVEKTIKNKRTATPEDQSIETIEYTVKFSNVNVKQPSTKMPNSGQSSPLWPALARKNNRTYTAPVHVDAHIQAKAFIKGSDIPKVRTKHVLNHRIASIPIMVGSDHCNTSINNHSREALFQMGEDPRDEGGYFIINGSEWAINMIESRGYNHTHVFHNVGHQNEIARLEFISKPGDYYENSKELKILYTTNKQITIEITATHFKGFRIPFYLIFRMFGMNTDKEIIDNIIYGYTKSLETQQHMRDERNRMYEIITTSLEAKDTFKDAPFNGAIGLREQRETINFVAMALAKKEKEDYREILEDRLKHDLLGLLDIHLLPHIGCDDTSRIVKLKFLGHLIHKLLLVEQDIIESTDRDELGNKRIIAAGPSYAKVMKTRFNLAVVQPLVKNFERAFKNTSFSRVQLDVTFRQSISGLDLERSLVQAITSGNKEISIKNKQVINRLASNQLLRKNQLNTISVLRTIRTPSTTSSKAAARSHEMRRVHPSYLGYICIVQSADTGEQVGLGKQMALSASIAPVGDSEFLKKQLSEDDLIIPIKDVMPDDIYYKNLAKIFVNGYWLGCCATPHVLVNKYRELRRDAFKKKTINPSTTIYWDTHADEVNFWIDMGRMIRPLLIVRNNKDNPEMFGTKYDPKKGEHFLQDIVLNEDDVNGILKGKIDITTLRTAGVIEYVAPEEQKNCYIAESLDVLRARHTDPLHQYTHCEIPIAMLGIVALTSPLSNHNKVVRIVYQTNQSKQTCGWYSLNYPWRVDKNQFFQYDCQMPLTKTISNKFTYPNGMNTIIAIACYGGNNQEDSLIANKAAIDRGQFNGSEFSFIRDRLEKDEEFRNPNETDTIDTRAGASYAHLVNGVVPKGTIISENDVVIAKLAKYNDPKKIYKYKDKSVVYRSQESAIVEDVIKGRDADDKKFIKVKLRAPRLPVIGDKFSSRHGQKGVIGMIYPQCDMPVTESGITPDFIINPHAIPTRMTLGQLREGVQSKLNAARGSISDGTIFHQADVEDIAKQLESYGYHRYGKERMYCGMTGNWIDALIFITPIYMQRLQKFVVDERYSIQEGHTDMITRQYLDGKAKLGGLRLGEMEKDVMVSHGTMRYLMEKFLHDSDLFYIYLCRKCGKRAIVNEAKVLYRCKTCGDLGDIVRIRSAWSSNLFFNELQGMNVGIKLGTTPYKYDNYM